VRPQFSLLCARLELAPFGKPPEQHCPMYPTGALIALGIWPAGAADLRHALLSLFVRCWPPTFSC
jgi:hypothetical protein